MPVNAAEVLDSMRVATSDARSNVFQIGSVSTPLNFASQQQRAFKLAWALDRSGLIEGKKIAVVGAGLAGITAGIICLLRDAKQVALYDRNHELMAFPHGAVHLSVHPMISRGPKPGAEVKERGSPILNGRKGTADAIRHEVVEMAETLLEGCYRKRQVD